MGTAPLVQLLLFSLPRPLLPIVATDSDWQHSMTGVSGGSNCTGVGGRADGGKTLRVSTRFGKCWPKGHSVACDGRVTSREVSGLEVGCKWLYPLGLSCVTSTHPL